MKLVSVATLATILALCLLCGCEPHPSPAKSDLINTDAGLHGELPYPVLSWKPLTVAVDRTQGTTSTLFSNGSTMARVTWAARDDPHWFGAHIAGAPQRVEIVESTNGTQRYRLFSGSPLAEQASAGDGKDRIAEIAAMRPIALP